MTEFGREKNKKRKTRLENPSIFFAFPHETGLRITRKIMAVRDRKK
jgi:hypothetical protein